MPEIGELYSERSKQMVVSRQIKRVFQAAEIDTAGDKEGRARAAVAVGFHSLRHTFVSLMAEKGAPLAAVQKLVGHSNPSMTRHYTHTTDAAALNAARLLELDAAPTAASRVPVPAWIRNLAQSMNAKNWKAIRAEFLEVTA